MKTFLPSNSALAITLVAFALMFAVDDSTLSAIVALFSFVWLVGIAIARFVGRRRHMTPVEHAYFYTRRQEKPSHLQWPGWRIPLSSVPRRPGLMLAVGAGVIALGMLVGWTTNGSDETGGGSPFVMAFVILAVTALTMLVRRIRRRNRHMTAAEHVYYWEHQSDRPEYLFWPGQAFTPQPVEPWSTFPMARFYESHRRMFLGITALLTTAVFVLIPLVVTGTSARADAATVLKIVDGDTLDVMLGDTVTRVRLLNVDTPELRNDTGTSDCLALQAKEALASLAPIGSPVELRYDRERIDSYGRTLAGVANADNVLINTELARLGLGSAMLIGSSDRYFRSVNSAEADAQRNEAGIYDPSVECGPAAALAEFIELVPEMTEELPTSSAELLALAGTVTAALVTLDSARDVMGRFELSSAARSYFLSTVNHMANTLSSTQAQIKLNIPKAKAVESEASARTAKAAADKAARAKKAESAKTARDQKAAAAEAKRAAADAAESLKAAEAESARIAEADAAARAAAEAEAARIAEADALAAAEAEAAADEAALADPVDDWPNEPDVPSGGASEDSGADSGGGYPSDAGYTGCRDYSGVGMIDKKGRSFKPIPCP